MRKTPKKESNLNLLSMNGIEYARHYGRKNRSRARGLHEYRALSKTKIISKIHILPKRPRSFAACVEHGRNQIYPFLQPDPFGIRNSQGQVFGQIEQFLFQLVGIKTSQINRLFGKDGTMVLSRSAKPPAIKMRFFSLCSPSMTSTTPGRMDMTKAMCPARTPTSPSSPGMLTCHAGSEINLASGETSSKLKVFFVSIFNYRERRDKQSLRIKFC